MSLYPRLLRFMTFTALCCEHSRFYQLQKVRALHELMQSHLCPAMDPILIQPHITRPLPPASSALGVCPDQTLTLLSTQFTILSTQLTLLLQSFTDTPPPHPLPHSESSSRSSNRLFVIFPHQPFQLVPTPTQYPGVLALWGSFLTPVCLYTLVPLFRAREQCTGHRRKVEEGTCHSLLLLQGAPCLSSSHSPQWVHLTIYESPCYLYTMNAGRCLSPASSVPGTLHLLCLLPGCFPR